MTKRKKLEILPTLKVEPKKNDELAIKFSEEYATDYILDDVEDVGTQYGDAVKLRLTRRSDETRVSVFVNATSMNNLIDAFGDDDTKWRGKVVKLSKQQSKGYDNEALIVDAVK